MSYGTIKIPFFLITGFLGSGKTTLLKQVLNKHADNSKIAIIQNEFAPASIDGTDLKHTGKHFEILEINKGSVFCVCLLSDFINSLSCFVDEHQPDAVFLEASGLADPIAIIELLQSPKLRNKLYLAHSWCIIDVMNFQKITTVNTRVNHQIRIADIVVLNKCDLFNEDKQPLYQKIKALNPFASIKETSFCNLSFDTLFDENNIPVALKRAEENRNKEPGGRPEIGMGVLKSTKKIKDKYSGPFLQETTNSTIRVKGYLNLAGNKTLAVQSSFGNTETKEITGYHGPTEIIFIGENIKIADINRKYKSYV